MCLVIEVDHQHELAHSLGSFGFLIHAVVSGSQHVWICRVPFYRNPLLEGAESQGQRAKVVERHASDLGIGEKVMLTGKLFSRAQFLNIHILCCSMAMNTMHVVDAVVHYICELGLAQRMELNELLAIIG